MKTKMIITDENLWNRIQSFSLDQPNVDFPFSKKLAKEENWTEDFTKKAIEEYKKFVYLCCILPNGASPSEIVDKVWHLHLVYTQNYWEEFCTNILKQKLHHQPSNGGSTEKIKHKNWFPETLKYYEEVFNEKAPDDIWLTKKEKPKRRKFWMNGFKILSVISTIFILSSCSSSVGNFLSFIFIYIPIIYFAITFLSRIFSNNDSNNNNKNNGGDGSSGGSCGGSSSSCSSSCGGGCGGCGGGGD
jgi:hypothetical protein